LESSISVAKINDEIASTKKRDILLAVGVEVSGDDGAATESRKQSRSFEFAVAESEKNLGVSSPFLCVSRHGNIGDVIAIEVGHGDELRLTIEFDVCARLKGAVPVAEEDGDILV